MRAEMTIPLGTQTFSKSRTQFPRGASPFYAARAEGSRLWDIDGNEYIDFNNSLAAITLGYRDPDVNAAVSAQLAEGVIFTLPHSVEVEAAELIVEMVPSAERVRFGKNGSDATAGAVRLARAFTGRDRVAVCGYHGWQDWYIGSTLRNLGVPQATRDLTSVFQYNNLESLRALLVAHPGEFAAVILEPMSVAWPAPGFLEGVAELTRSHGALLIFDEIVTGFRFANGGAQELFGVTPDLTALGKSIANGFPLSAVAGRADVMKLMEEIFFSFTMGGEALSLAAAIATMKKIKSRSVTAKIAETGNLLLDGVRLRIEKYGIEHFAEAAGHPSWSFVLLKDLPDTSSFEIKTLFMQECLARGILTLGSHNMSYAHSADDVARLLAVYDEVFPLLRDAVANRSIRQYLHCEPLQPLFKVR
ncbi:MAG: aminotransferase class III-fold pyridoxal phosphate-dependent enzyme [Afipia sp.]